MKTKEEIEQLAQEIHYDSAQQGLDANGCFNQYQGFIKGYTQCQEDVDWELLVKLSKRYTEEDLYNILRLRKEWYSHTDKNVVRDFIKLKK